MNVVKLTMHEAMYRLAFTEEWWRANADDPEQDRLIARWEKPDPIAHGWRHALAIDIPSSSLGPALPEKRVKDGNLVRFPAPAPDHMLRFVVLIREASAAKYSVNDVAGEVGRMPLGNGSALWVIAFEFLTPPAVEEQLVKFRSEARAAELNPNANPASLRGWAWGSLDEGGVPAALDAGPVF